MKIVTAVTALLIHEGRVLSVSRKNDPHDLGLPGGSVERDQNETPEAAAARELLEETGLVAEDLRLVFERQDGEHFVQTFRVMKWSGTISTKETGVVAWAPPWKILEKACKSFRDYNRQLFDHIGLDAINPRIANCWIAGWFEGATSDIEQPQPETDEEREAFARGLRQGSLDCLVALRESTNYARGIR